MRKAWALEGNDRASSVWPVELGQQRPARIGRDGGD
jgi:hypothetical protein